MSVALHPTLDDLRTIDVFQDLSVDELQWLSDHIDLQEYKAGELVTRAGDPADFLNVIFKGEIRGERRDGLSSSPVQVRSPVSSHIRASLTSHPMSIASKMAPPVACTKVISRRWPSAFLSCRSALSPSWPTAFVKPPAPLISRKNSWLWANSRPAWLTNSITPPPPASAPPTICAKPSKIFAIANGKLAKLNLDLESRRFLIDSKRSFRQSLLWLRSIRSIVATAKKISPPGWKNMASRMPGPSRLIWSMPVAPSRLLEQIAARIPKEYLGIALARLTASLNINRLLDEIENSMKRITEMVRAVKDYSYMDQMPEQEVDIHDGIDTTLIMLKHRLKNGVEVIREYDRNIPRMTVRGRELNQVWTNLITNAVDAMNGKGILRIQTKCADGRALVEIIDNGTGIPPEIRDRIFEPFFTTKGVNEGTGLGLDIAARVVRNHGGDIQVDSKPGHTVFGVRLPLHCPNNQEDQAVRNSG